MCGIAGLYNLDGAPVSASHVQHMCDLMIHRGPDDSGLWTDGPIGLGQRRLAIIDLSPRGRNPIANEDETIQFTFNGEIYNYRELRSDLLRQGHRFRSDTDSEVVLHLYEEKGLDCISSLNGMFAFALWDGRGRRLLLGRDRFGVKPFYYVIIGSTLAFASEVKAFLALPGFKAVPNPVALAEHFTFQNTFGDLTFFDGVKLLPAGHFLTVENGQIRTQQYWDLRFEPDSSISFNDWAHYLREHFETAVTRQLMSEVPVGAYLSGGMDTGAISAIAARHIPDLNTFTCGFDLPDRTNELEQYFDERDESQRLARTLGTIHRELELGPDAMEPSLASVVWHLDEPRVGISYQIFYTTEMIHRFVKVVLSGVGGDELFAGYPWRYEPIIGADRSSFEAEYYKYSTRFLTDDEKRGFFSPAVNQALGDFSTFDSFRAVLKPANHYDVLHQALYFDFKTFLNGLLLVDDKLAMAHSVEARVPFLDNDLVELAAGIPSSFKLNRGRGKLVLREAMRGLLPDETLRRRKQGFTPPDQSWYKLNSWDYIRDLVLGPRARDRGYFEPSYIEKILDDHLNDRRNNRFLIWSLMCFEWWNRLFVDRDAPPARVDAKLHG